MLQAHKQKTPKCIQYIKLNKLNILRIKALYTLYYGKLCVGVSGNRRVLSILNFNQSCLGKPELHVAVGMMEFGLNWERLKPI